MRISNLSKTNFLSFIRNWKIVNQILFAQLLITFVLFSFLLAATFISQRIFQETLKVSSDEIFVKETAWSLKTINIYKQSFQEVLKSAEMQIHLINSLYFAVQRFKNFTAKAPLQCLNKPHTNDTYSYSSSSCYALFGNGTDKDLQEIQPCIHVTSLLTEFRAAIDYSQALYFSQKNDAQFYTINAGFYFPKGFQPHIRPWYQFHVNSTKNSTSIAETIYGNPYKVVNNGVRIPSTMNLINLEKQFDGVVAKDINFNQTELFKATDNTLNLIKRDGTVIYSKLYDNQSQVQFNLKDEIYSGFNASDLEQIIAFHYSKPFVSNCINFQKDDLLCRFNSIANQSRIILTANITGSPYIMLLLKDPTLLIKDNQDQMILIQSEIQKLNDMTILVCCLTIVFIVIFSLFFVNIILRQLNEIIQYTNFKMVDSIKLQKNPIQCNKNKCTHTRAVTNLCKSVFQLLHYLKPNGKCLECKFEESKRYPQQSRDNCKYEYNITESMKKYFKYGSVSVKQRKSLISLVKKIYD